MEKTRGNTSGPLNRWDAHRAELTDKALSSLNNAKVKQAFRDWVVKGENAPQYGDVLYDQLMCSMHGMLMNRMFMFKTWEYGEGEDYIVYSNCILRVKFGNHPPGTLFDIISVDPMTLEISACDMTLQMYC
jgi:hypothetical protein